MVSDLERVERVNTTMEPARRPQDRALGYIAVSSDCYRNAGSVGVCGGRCARVRVAVGGERGGPEEVAADYGFRLDDRFAAEDDVLRAVDLGSAGDFVPRVLVFGG